MIKAIIFDMEGVLIDSLEYNWDARNQYFKEKYGFEVTKKDIDSMIGISLRDQLEMINKIYGVNLEYDTCSREFSLRQLDLMRKGIKPNKQTREFIEDVLADDKKIAICSHNIRNNVDEEIKIVGLEGLFDIIVTIEDFAKYKPHPESLLYASEKLGIKPAECAVIEDSPKGIIAAKKANMYAIGYRTRFNSEKALLDAGADIVISEFSQIKELK